MVNIIKRHEAYSTIFNAFSVARSGGELRIFHAHAERQSFPKSVRDVRWLLCCRSSDLDHGFNLELNFPTAVGDNDDIRWL